MIQQRVSPPVAQTGYNFSDAPVNPTSVIESGTRKDKINFKDLITDSVESVKKEREAKKNGDLSGAKTDAEFLEKLAEASKPQRTVKNTLDKDDFLKLFVTQLQHQDPLNPDDGAEMAAKLAQFNSVEQMMNVNSSLQKLLDAQNVTKNQGLIQYIGKEAALDGGKVSIKDGKVESAPYLIGADSPNVTLQVYDKAGNLVSEKEMGMLKKGAHRLDWQGFTKNNEKAADGQYTFKLISKDNSGVTSPVDIKTRATITGIDFENAENNIQTNLGKIKLADIKALGTAAPASVEPETARPAAAAPAPVEPRAAEETPKAPPASTQISPLPAATPDSMSASFKEAAAPHSSPLEPQQPAPVQENRVAARVTPPPTPALP
jgi:flagellar basal-body rod modification protein FlgD